jgi:hypothetical protein
MRNRTLYSILGVLVAGVITELPRDASACGGTFCDGGGPTTMPVDQRGENILFVQDETTVEAHIQIQYQGDAKRFAWVIPVQALPEFSVGSQLLFDRLLQGSVPTYGYSTQQTCSKGSGEFGGTGTGGGAAGPPDDGAGGGSNGGPTIVYKATVGAFDITVLSGGTVDEVVQWLGANGYSQPADAPPILESYLQQGFLFAAIKLTGGNGTDEIHPLVLKYTGNRPCVPIRLTAVAAVENMAIRTFFLGNERAFPTNYKHVVLNPARIDWMNLAANYVDTVNQAVDSPIANGKAFVTEYAGPSNVVQTSGVYSTTWNAAPFAELAPTAVITQLQAEGLVYCDGGASCQFNHPLVAPLLHEFLPVPDGIPEGAFYGCLSCYETKIDVAKWNGSAFAAAMDDRIVKPGKHAVDILTANPYLTRMFTTLSPAEMTEDPEFHTRADQGDVTASRIGSRVIDCACTAMTLPDGRVIALDASGTWPVFDVDMPFADKVQEVPVEGDVINLVDNAGAIDGLLTAHNTATCPVMPGAGGATTTGAGGAPSVGQGGTTSTSTGGGASPGQGATTGSGATGSGAAPTVAAAPGSKTDDDGCSVSRAGSSSTLGDHFGLVSVAHGLAAALRRRRKIAE